VRGSLLSPRARTLTIGAGGGGFGNVPEAEYVITPIAGESGALRVEASKRADGTPLPAALPPKTLRGGEADALVAQLFTLLRDLPPPPPGAPAYSTSPEGSQYTLEVVGGAFEWPGRAGEADGFAKFGDAYGQDPELTQEKKKFKEAVGIVEQLANTAT
jgi:hypothetical protein